MDRQHRLIEILQDCDSVCIGYSGGVDSVFLAVYALDVLGADRILAVTGRSASYPLVQWETARAIAREFGIPHLEIGTDELSDRNYLANPTNRCYFCKTELWSRLAPVARARGLETIVDGSNADDAHDYRPGAQAAREHGVRSPLQEAGLTKAEIRELSRARSLPTWDQPSAPCLSSRLPYGLAVTPERLRQVEAAEQIVRDLGIREFRVRHHGTLARLEVAPAELQTMLRCAQHVNAALRELGFGQVLLDVEGYRSGSLNQGLTQLKAPNTSEIAVVDQPLEHARRMAPELRQRGFRYVAIDLRMFA
ncbi:MAG: ATP-dependent sacrificial sulfur transferase LarE [Gemmatimonadota bacterium]